MSEHEPPGGGFRHRVGILRHEARWFLMRQGRRPRVVAFARCVWLRLAKRDYVENCQVCARRYMTFLAPDDVWLAVMDTPKGGMCPACFDRRAASRGLHLVWSPWLNKRGAMEDFAARAREIGAFK